MQKWRVYGGVFLRGIAMGAADVVPGVSGGTIAFITGIYTRLINAIAAIGPDLWTFWRHEGLAKTWSRIDGGFLLALFAGILTSVVTLAGILKYLLVNEPILIHGFFFGLVAASVWVLLREIKDWHFVDIALFAVGIIIAVMLALIPALNAEHGLGFLFFAAALAICAMILPGISGAFILLLLGAYQQVLSAVHHFDIAVLAILAMGALTGLLTFTHLLKWLFAHYYRGMMALLTGFVAGSLYKIWPWQVEGVHFLPLSFAEGDNLWAFILMIVGVGLVLIMNRMGQRHEEHA